MNIIEIENLSHRFADGTMGLEGINLKIREGSFVIIAGLNGSGKTTLLRHLNGLLLATEGIVRLAGTPVEKDLLKARQFVGMMFQDADSQIVGETVYEDVAFGPENLRMARGKIKRQVSEALSAGALRPQGHGHQALCGARIGQERRLRCKIHRHLEVRSTGRRAAHRIGDDQHEDPAGNFLHLAGKGP